MRYVLAYPKYGDKKEVERYQWWPIAVKTYEDGRPRYEIRWLEWVTVEYTYVTGWEATNFR